jgi:hypothetical protein
MLIDVVFSLDSVITAVGMVRELAIMVIAVVLAVGVMMVAAGAVSAFVERHPTVKMLALSFLLLIGVALIADGFEQHIPRGYIYFAMGFSVFVEALNLRLRRQANRPPPGPHPEAKHGGPSPGLALADRSHSGSGPLFCGSLRRYRRLAGRQRGGAVLLSVDRA